MRTDRQVDDVELRVQGREPRLEGDQGLGRFLLQALLNAPNTVSARASLGRYLRCILCTFHTLLFRVGTG